jgi:hypothetical protein
MDNLNGTKPPMRPATTAGAETAAMQAHVIEAGSLQRGMAKQADEADDKNAQNAEIALQAHVFEASSIEKDMAKETTEADEKPAKPAPDNGMKNYFVRPLILSVNHLLTPLASVSSPTQPDSILS